MTQKLLDVAQGVAKQELESEDWLRLMSQAAGRSYEQMRVATLEFLETEVFNISVENCVAFLESDDRLLGYGPEDVSAWMWSSTSG